MSERGEGEVVVSLRLLFPVNFLYLVEGRGRTVVVQHHAAAEVSEGCDPGIQISGEVLFDYPVC